MTQVVEFAETMESFGPAVVAIGVFDGVHLGHKQLLSAAVAHARELGVASVALTFDRDPDQVIDPASAAPQLLTLADKTHLISESGVDRVLVVPFTAEIAALKPEEFLARVLARALEPRAIHVGHDFRFGAKAAGDVSALESWAVPRGASVIAHELFEADGAPVTSTRVRALVARGEVEAAARLLGRPTRVTGVVVHGRGAGRAFGIPTANVTPLPFSALPSDGVYAGRAELAEQTFAAAISVGTPPMFPEAKDYLEAHLIGFDGTDLYDASVTLEFVSRLRPLVRFGSTDELVAAMHEDIERAAAAAALDSAENSCS